MERRSVRVLPRGELWTVSGRPDTAFDRFSNHSIRQIRVARRFSAASMLLFYV